MLLAEWKANIAPVLLQNTSSIVSGVVIRLKCILALLKNIELNKGSLESAVPLESGFGICFLFYQNNNSLTDSVG